MTPAFVTPASLAAATSFKGDAVRARNASSRATVRASLADNIAKRARMDSEKVLSALQSPVVRGAAVGLVAAAALISPNAASALTRADIEQLTYSQVKGSGLANRCPEVEGAKGSIKLESGKSYKIVDLCLEPKTFLVEEEVTTKKGKEAKKAFVDTKLMTRATYTLTGIEGPLTVDNEGLTFTEKDGIDYAATTVQLPGGERVPFLFTVKNLVAKAETKDITTATEFGGDFKVPSYRTGLFLDPKGRGGVTGYDMAVALPAMEADGGDGQDELFKETNKIFQVTDGAIEMAVQKIDPDAKEMAGVFVSEQLSDTDMGAKQPKKILLKGVFFGRVEEV